MWQTQGLVVIDDSIDNIDDNIDKNTGLESKFSWEGLCIGEPEAHSRPQHW